MNRQRAFRYNIRRQARPSNRLALLVFIIIFIGIGASVVSPRQWFRRDASPSPDLRYESWSPPKRATRPPTKADLEQLQEWLDETDEQLYAGTFPDIKIQWAADMNNAYAFTHGDEIKFVRSKFYPGWAGNRDVVLHEMAHLATGHDHNILWDQERARLAEGRRVMTFEQVRKASR